MQLGSIHKDERSARRAAEALVKAGIERERVRLVRPRTLAKAGPALERPRLRATDVLGGAGFGGACGALACAVLAIMRTSYVVADPLGAMLAVLAAGALAGAATVLFMRHREAHEPAPRAAISRARRNVWAVVVDARDARQGAIAAAALKTA